MASDFDSWVESLFPDDHAERGDLPAGVMDLLRATFATRGPVGPSELDDIFDALAMDMARAAVALFVADVKRTTELTPRIEIYRDEHDSPVVSWNGGFTAPAFVSARIPEVTCEIADNLRDHVLSDLSAVWPVCPSDAFGLNPRVVDGRAVWFCGHHPDGEVSLIGQLPASAAARQGLGSRFAAPALTSPALRRKERKRRNRQR